jgi:succinyl-CoA synthetase beta subunit
MKLLEYEGKDLLAKSSIPIPLATLIKPDSTHTLTYPAVLKSQVPVGGRGKAGGIIIVESADQLQASIDKLFNLEIKGYRPNAILAEEKLSIKAEYYLSLLIDKTSSSIQLIANINGGVEVETNLGDSFLNIAVGKDSAEAAGQQMADYLNLPDKTFVLQDLVENIYKCFVKNDATLIEINPLVLTTDGKFVAGDCKITLDNNAAFRHDWNYEDSKVETNFVTLNPDGNVATIANGAGLAMATVDAVADAGMVPANFMDIGGGSDSVALLDAFRRISEYKHVKAIVINVFGGITRCDQVAAAIIEAKSKINNLPQLFIRLAGTNYNKAAEILKIADIPILDNLSDCLQAAHAEVNL